MGNGYKNQRYEPLPCFANFNGLDF